MILWRRVSRVHTGVASGAGHERVSVPSHDAGQPRAHRPCARSLFLAEGTVKNYVSEILEKLGARDRTRAVLKAITLRLI